MLKKCGLFFILFILFCLACGNGNSEGPETGEKPTNEQVDPFTKAREQMVNQQIVRRGVKDEKVLAAMRKVPRHKFVPSVQVPHSYEDRPLPIGHGQTISQPYIVAVMTELLKPNDKMKALEVGTGSGYQAAILAEIVEEVKTIEIIKALGNSAKKRLENMEYKNIEVKVADGYYGWEEHAPFDIIIVTAAVDHIPPALMKQLKPGGRLVIPIGPPFTVQDLVLVKKSEKGEFTTEHIFPVRFVPLTGKH
jgi:protein-L-isoaspartate(D-aspartate) O-methyltransferase